MIKDYYFDMDGTLLDLYGVDNWLPRLRACDPTPYRDARPLVDVVLFDFLCRVAQNRGARLQVVSWLSMNAPEHYNEAVTDEKIKSLARYFPRLLQLPPIIIPYGTPKHEQVTNAAGAIYDDSAEVGEAWEQNGGIWVNAKTTDISKLFTIGGVA